MRDRKKISCFLPEKKVHMRGDIASSESREIRIVLIMDGRKGIDLSGADLPGFLAWEMRERSSISLSETRGSKGLGGPERGCPKG